MGRRLKTENGSDGCQLSRFHPAAGTKRLRGGDQEENREK